MEKREIYLDNAATTCVDSAVSEEVYNVMVNCFGNPSSSHSKGVEAYQVIDSSRRAISKLLYCDLSDIIFTSGGTESNNLAISGIVDVRLASKKNIVTSAVEHSSVMDNMKKLQSIGFEVRYVKPDSEGNINPSDVWENVDENTLLVSIMHINNETGNIYDIKTISRGIRAKSKNAIFHCDGVQAFGKIKTDVVDLDIDLYSFSGHKIHAPKGIGGLYIKPGVRIKPMIIGGHQESGLRGGTENVLGISGIGKACEVTKISKNLEYVRELHDLLALEISKIENIHINSKGNVSPYLFNFSLEGFRSEIVLNKLQEKGVYVSSGSACSKGKKSKALKGMGLADKYIDSAIRVGLSHYNTKEDILEFCREIKELKILKR